MSNVVTKDQLAAYTEHGYAVVKNVLPEELLQLAQRIVEPWVEMTIDHWNSQGLLAGWDTTAVPDFKHRLLSAWETAGRPYFRRSPFRNLFREETYHLFKHPTLLALAEDLLGTPEISVHGAFNYRCGLPDTHLTATPCHQDVQYASEEVGEDPVQAQHRHIVSMWFPLQRVDQSSGCLQFMSLKDTHEKLFEPYDYGKEETGFIGLSPADIERYPMADLEMDRSDLLVFNQISPHGAAKHTADHVRWSFDIRYIATSAATTRSKKYGFIAQSRLDPDSVTPCEEWLKQRQTGDSPF
jgi:phytanoyl-CoA hydroxylase